MRSHHFHTLVLVCESRAAQLCIRSAKHACSQALASTVWKDHKANDTITTLDLGFNNISDGGAIAMAESLKATLLMGFRLVRTTPFDVASASAIFQEKFCHLRHVSVGVLVCETDAI